MPTIPERTRDFLAALDEIDLRNADYFLFQPAETNGSRDKLNNHCRFELQGDRALFGFLDGSDVPNNIRKRCYAEFIRFFPDGDVVGKLLK